MKFHIEVAEVYGNDNSFKPEQEITNGESFSKTEAQRKRDLMQKYTNSLKYKIKRTIHANTA